MSLLDSVCLGSFETPSDGSHSVSHGPVPGPPRGLATLGVNSCNSELITAPSLQDVGEMAPIHKKTNQIKDAGSSTLTPAPLGAREGLWEKEPGESSHMGPWQLGRKPKTGVQFTRSSRRPRGGLTWLRPRSAIWCHRPPTYGNSAVKVDLPGGSRESHAGTV